MPFLFRPHSADTEYLRTRCTDRPSGRTGITIHSTTPRTVNCKTLMIWEGGPRLSNMSSIFAETPDPPLAEERVVFLSCPSSLPPTLWLEATPQVPWLEPQRRQFQHHGKGSSRARREKNQKGRPRPLTGVCCDGSPERLVDPCLELNLFHDSANLPRLALRLRRRLSAPSSRSGQPRSTSAASLHFFPMLSSPGPAGRHLSPPALTPACAQFTAGAAFASTDSCRALR